MPAAAAIIPAVIAGGAGIGSALINRSAAGSASDAQVRSSQEAMQYIKDLLAQYNPQIGTTAQTAADMSTKAGQDAIAQLRDILAQNRTDVLGGVGQANEALAPYRTLGTDTLATLKDLMAPGGELNRTFNFQDIQNLDPGYQFRMDQANKALMSSAAAKGGALGGGALQALASLNQNLASSEAGAAFSRLTQQQQDRFNRLNSLLGTGFQAAGQTGQNIMAGNTLLANQGITAGQNIGQWMIQPAQFAGTAITGAAETMANNAMTTGRSVADLMTGAGNARAAGIVGQANSLGGALSSVAGGANAIGKYYQDQQTLNQLKDIFKNPAIIKNLGEPG